MKGATWFSRNNELSSDYIGVDDCALVCGKWWRVIMQQ